MDDLEENAAIINALQRRSDVIVQKSLAEGFGLTVAEAMWKGTPTIGSRVGGIHDQIESGESGVLVDPRNDEEFGSALASLLSDPAAAAEMAENGRRRVTERYLAPSYLSSQHRLIRRMARVPDSPIVAPEKISLVFASEERRRYERYAEPQPDR